MARADASADDRDQVPAIRSFQFDTDAIGAIANSVNLFRGDVNVALPLLTLPGRNGMDVAVSALYQSNVQGQVDRWNREAPTEILGLGWSLPFDRIEVDPNRSGSLDDHAYVLYQGGNPVQLLRSAEPWPLFDLPASFRGALDGGRVTAELAAEFAAHGLELTVDAPIARAGSGWEIADGAAQRTFRVADGTAVLPVEDGGMGFEAESYDFSKIRYEPGYQLWRVVGPDGGTSLFGGNLVGPGPGWSATDNVIQWGVRWGNWYGNSTLADSVRVPQERYPVAWNLARRENRWGDRVSYAYRVVEQPVGEGGLAYTKACYQEEIRDTFGRTVGFEYDPKVYQPYDPADPASADLPREYQDPHKAVPDDRPNAFQDRYETLFLKRLAVQDGDGQPLYHLDFACELANASGIAAGAGDPLYGDTTKRFLTGVIQGDPAGNSLPGMRFDYYLADTDPHPGALRTLTYPQGGTATYTYEVHDLPLCARELTLERPAAAPRESWVPRVWFGSDYAVVAWFNTDSNLLDLAVYSWLGYWYRWASPRTLQAPLKLDGLAVEAQEDFFLLSFPSSREDLTTAFLFHRLDNTPGHWVMAEEELRFPSLTVDFETGRQFALAVDPGGKTLTRATWQWATRQWLIESFDLGATFCATGVSSDRQYYTAAGPSYYLVLCYDRGADPGRKKNRLQLFHLDALGQWREGGTTYPDDIVIAQQPGRTTFFWTPGATFAVASYQTRSSGGAFDYALQVFHWDEGYRFVDDLEHRQELSGQDPVPWIGRLVSDSLVGSGPHLLRFDGLRWQHKYLGRTLPANPATAFWYAYGDDLALATENGSGQIVSTQGAYDADTDSTDWTTAPVRLANITEPLPFQKTHLFPTVGSDWATLGREVYFRGTSNDWASLAERRPVYTVPEDQTVDTTTLVDFGPSFLAYQQVAASGSTLKPLAVRVLNLKNGRVAQTESIEEQMFKVYDLDGYPQARSGEAPAGPQMLLTFPLTAKSFDQTPSLTLRRHIDGRVDGTVRAFTVTRLSIDTGYEVHRTGYEYDRETALCDPTGQVVKYFRAGQFALEDGVAGRPYGTTESIFLNGLETDHPSLRAARGSAALAAADLSDLAQDWTVLDGYLKRQNLYDASGNLVSYTENGWLPLVAVEDPAGAVVPLRGAWVAQVRQSQLQDGVTLTTTYGYDLSSGQRTSQEAELYGSQGTPETQRQETTYGYQVYPELRAQNLLTVQAQVLNRVAVDGGAAVTANAAATRYRPWPKPAAGGGTVMVLDAFDTWSWRGGGTDPAFTAWDPAANPGTEWLRTAVVTLRSPRGQVVEAEDALGTVNSILWDRDERYRVATFGNASLAGDEASYLGFESYETAAGWQLSSGGSFGSYVVDDRGHTGRRSLALSAATTGSRSLERTFTPGNQRGRYVFGVWYQPDPAFVPVAGAGWTITVLRGGTPIATYELPFAATAGVWRYASQGVDLAGFEGGGTLSIAARGANPTAPRVLVDDLRFTPLPGAFDGRVYDPGRDLETARLGPSLQTSRTAYDEFLRPVTTAGPDENVQGLAASFLSRQRDDRFHAELPNAEVAVTGTGRGFFGDFLRDGRLDGHFATDAPGNWAVEDGQLVHRGATESTLRLTEPAIRENWAVVVTVAPVAEPTRPLGLRVGEEVTLAWDPATGRWTLTDHGAATPATLAAARPQPTRGRFVADPGRLQRQWLLVVAGQVVLFYADGEQLFSYPAGREVTGEPGLFAGDPVAFPVLAVSDGVQVATSFRDGAGNERQTQALIGADAIVKQVVYDPEGRKAVETKPAQLAAATGQPLLAYRAGFVERFDWVSGVMSGEVARYYSPGGGGFSDDQGYPYSRERYEASPLGRVIERGKPGRAFAITDLATTGPAERHTTRTAYGANTTGGFMPWLPAGRYRQTTTTDPDGRVRVEVQDATGQTVGQGALEDPGTSRYNTTAYQWSYGPDGKTTVTRLPNAFAPPPGSTAAKWVITTLTDPLGQVVQEENPDGGRSEMVYDPLGNLRFRQSALGRNQGWLIYQRYDGLSRPVETGSLGQPWDRVALQRKADAEPAWPPTPVTWSRISRYDGDGADPLAVGNLTAVLVARPDGSGEAATRETFQYNPGGKVVEQALEWLESSASYPLGFRYDNQGNRVRVLYRAEAGDGDAVPEVTYRYDPVGRLAAVGSGEGAPAAYAAYTYNANGSVATEELAPGTAAATTRRYSYISPGWQSGVTDPRFSQTTYYTADQGGRPGYYSGLVAEDAFAFAGTLPPGAVAQYAYRYRYDPLTQLASAEATAGGLPRPEWSLGSESQPVTYDGNGNFTVVPEGGAVRSFVYYPGSDQVKNTDGSNTDAYGYDDDGSVIRALPRGLSRIDYDRVTARPRTVTAATGEVAFAYDGRARRIRKVTTGEDRLYLRGPGGQSLLELVSPAGGGTARTRYVYGRAGLLGLVRDGRFSLVLPDRLGSSRLLVADDGAVAACWSYLPFGELLGSAGAVDALSYLFTGQELDRDLGLYNANARLYDPALGRFYSTDPQWQFASPYIYAGNDPILFVDPTGEKSHWQAALVISTAILATLAGIAITVATAGAASWGVVIVGGLIGGALIGGGLESASFGIAHVNDEWDGSTWGDWAKGTFTGVGVGLVTGGLTAGIGTGASALAARGTFAGAKSVAAWAIGGGVVQGLANGGAQVVDNLAAGDPAFNEAVLTSALVGVFIGAAAGASGVRAGAQVARTLAAETAADQAALREVDAVFRVTDTERELLQAQRQVDHYAQAFQRAQARVDQLEQGLRDMQAILQRP
jgi:RHS repeat-associated protein